MTHGIVEDGMIRGTTEDGGDSMTLGTITDGGADIGAGTAARHIIIMPDGTEDGIRTGDITTAPDTDRDI